MHLPKSLFRRAVCVFLAVIVIVKIVWQSQPGNVEKVVVAEITNVSRQTSAGVSQKLHVDRPLNRPPSLGVNQLSHDNRPLNRPPSLGVDQLSRDNRPFNRPPSPNLNQPPRVDRRLTRPPSPGVNQLPRDNRPDNRPPRPDVNQPPRVDRPLNRPPSLGVNQLPHVHRPLDDFIKYPCLPMSQPFGERYFSTERCVRMFNDTETDYRLTKNCVRLKTMNGLTPICTYDAEDDVWVSKSLQTKGEWEGDLVANISQFLLSNPGSEFLDLGCNIGTFTIAIAHIGVKVAAVDPMLENLRLLNLSLALGNLREKVTLIWNAVSDKYSEITLVKSHNNVGGTQIRESVNSNTKHSGPYAARAITLDDLIPIYKGKRVVIKMDIETSEYKALRGGDHFFDLVDVPIILMEFAFHKTSSTGPKIIEFLERKGFHPYADSKQQKPLNKNDFRDWPGDMYFIKR